MSKNQVKKPSLGKKKETKKTGEKLSVNLEALDNVLLEIQKNLNMDLEKVSETVVPVVEDNPVVEAKPVEKSKKKIVVNKPSNKMMTKD